MNPIAFYRIAGFDMQMNCVSPFMLKRLEPYRLDPAPVQDCIDLCYTPEDRAASEETDGWFEYNWTMQHVVRHLVERQALCFHSSAISVDGQAILFSADSGTGKSTHARLWKQYKGADHIIVQLNDDKPIIRLMGKQAVAWGTPWSGKHNIDTNASAPVKTLIFLARGEENKIERVLPKNALSLVLPQVLGCKYNQQEVFDLLTLLDTFLTNTPIYLLHCNISEDAVNTVYDRLRKDGVLK